MGVKQGGAPVIQLDIGVLDIQSVDVGSPPGCRQQIIEGFRYFAVTAIHKRNGNAAVYPLDLLHMRIRIQRKFVVECLQGVVANGVILDRADRPANPEHTHPHAQSAQRLTQLQTNHPRTKNRDRVGEVLPFENIVIHHQAILGVVQETGDIGPRSGRNDNAPGLHLKIVTDLQTIRGHEPGVPLQKMRFRKLLHRINHRRNEPVPFASHPFHNPPAIDADALGRHAKNVSQLHLMRIVGGRNQQLAWHASYSGAGGPVLIALDQHDLVGHFAHTLVGHHTGGTSSDNGNIYGSLFHSRLS